MADSKDKKTTNNIIALGYCILVIIILFNYLSKTPRKSKIPPRNVKIHHQNGSLVGDDLEGQLKEQRRMNREMREMIIDIQNAKLSEQQAKYALRTNAAPKKSRLEPLVDLNSLTLPELSPRIEEKFKKEEGCPFEADRNPFVSPIVMPSDLSEMEEVNSFVGHAVVCNPKLPYLFTGTNSNLKVISNY